MASPAQPRSGGFAIRLAGIRWALAIAGVVLGTAAGTCAFAQQVAPSRVTPETLQPAPTPAPTSLDLGAPSGLTPPANAEKLSVTPGQVVADGTFPELQTRTEELLAPLRGKKVTVAWIYDTANALEHAYGEAGYFLARIVIPPQKLVDGGPLHFKVIDGVIERIEVKDVPEHQRALVAARLAPLVGVHHLKLPEIERRLLLISDIPGLQVRSTLSPGNAPGSTLLVMQGKQAYASGTFGFDDRLPASLGTRQLNASAALNGALGLGEQAYLSIDQSPDFGLPRLRVFGGGFVLPIGNDGLTLNPEYTKSIARPIPPPGTPATQGDFQRAALRANYPLIRSRAENLTVQAAMEWDDETLTPLGFDVKLYHDSYGVGRLRAIYTFSPLPDLPLQLTGSLSHGLTGRNANADLPLSRFGARPTFTAAFVEADMQYPLPESLVLVATGRVQTSFDNPLMLSEQFALDGLTALSAFADGTFSVDQGATLRAEIRRPFTVPIAGQNLILSPYIFGAGGWGELVVPTAVEHRDIGAGALGVGMRTDITVAGYAAGSLIFEFARKFSDVPAAPPGYRANLSLSLRF